MMTAGFTAILSNPVTILLIFMGVAIGIVFGSIRSGTCSQLYYQQIQKLFPGYHI